jgi:hypothetical protein
MSRDGLKKADAHILYFIDKLAIRFQPAVSDTQNQFGFEYSLEIDAILDKLDRRSHLIGEFHLADAQRSTATRLAKPAQMKTGELPECVKPKAARHDRVTLKMAGKEPEIRLDIKLRPHMALAVDSAVLADGGNPVEHQHGWQRQLGIAGAEKLTATAGQKLIPGEAGAALGHGFFLILAVATGDFIDLLTGQGMEDKRVNPPLQGKNASIFQPTRRESGHDLALSRNGQHDDRQRHQ